MRAGRNARVCARAQVLATEFRNSAELERVVGLLPHEVFVNGVRFQRLKAADVAYAAVHHLLDLQCMGDDKPGPGAHAALVHFNWLVGSRKVAMMRDFGMWHAVCDAA